MSLREATPEQVGGAAVIAGRGSARRRQLGDQVRLLPVYIVLGLGGIFALVPFIWMLSTSLKSQAQLFVFPPEWIPNPVLISNYAEAWSALPFSAMLLNTIFVTALAMFGELASASRWASGSAEWATPAAPRAFTCIMRYG